MENTNSSLKMKDEQESKSEEFWSLTGTKPFFSVIIARSHLKPYYRLRVAIKVHRLLPCQVVPVVLKYQGKEWSMNYDGLRKNFDKKWRHFVDDNDVKFGDGCMFELEECSVRELVFRVQILNGEFPPELAKNIPGMSSESPIVII